MQSSTTPVCVIIAAANAESTIARAVASALAQCHVEEVVVVDDASGDRTSDNARSADDRSGRLTVIALPKNVGPAAARNVALSRSRSAGVCVLDADDYLLPGRIAALLERSGDDWDILADDILILPESVDESTLPSRFDRPATDYGTIDLETFVLNNISNSSRPRGEFGFLKPIMRRSFLLGHGLRYDEGLRLGEDYALYVRALLAGARFRVVGACGYVAVERAFSLSGRHSANDLLNLMTFDEQVLHGAPGLTDRDRRALQSHLRATRHKYDYRRVLNCRQRDGLPSALALMARRPSSFFFILAETVRARSKHWFLPPDSGGTRYLIGTRLVRPSGRAEVV